MRPQRVIGGVDTHKDIHVAVVIDDLGRRLDTASFATTTAGYRDCYRWLGGYGEILAVGVEGTGSCRDLGVQGARWILCRALCSVDDRTFGSIAFLHAGDGACGRA